MAWWLCPLLLLASASRAAVSEKQDSREISVHVGAAFYEMFDAGVRDLFLGPSVTIDYGVPRSDHVWIDLGVSLTRGACFGGPDGCVLRPGLALEPNGGIKLKTAGFERWLAYAKLTGGVLLMVPDGDSPLGVAALARAGGGLKWRVSKLAAFGVEATGALGIGRFAFGGRAQHELASVEVGLGIEARF